MTRPQALITRLDTALRGGVPTTSALPERAIATRDEADHCRPKGLAGPSPEPARSRPRRVLPGIALVVPVFVLGCAPRPDLPPDLQPLVAEAEDRCGGLDYADKEGCYEEVLFTRLDEAGVYQAIRLLEAIGSVDRDVERAGHMYVHGIGITAYQNNPTWAETFDQCTALYQSGCYHGVIQARFMEMGEITEADLNGLCASYKSEGSARFVLFQCLHGIGHGLTLLNGHDLPVALEACDQLSENWDRQSCYGGAFMENIMNSTAPHHMVAEATEARLDAGAGGSEHIHTASAWAGLVPEDPLFPCSVVAERYLRECYVMQTSAILWLNDGDVGGAADTCLTAPENMRQLCIQSLGRDIAGRVVGDHSRGIRECSKAERSLRPWCHVGFVKNLIDVSARTDGAFAFCPRLDDETSRLMCYEAIGEQLYVLRATSEERAQDCAAVAEAEAQACRFGARLTSQRPEM